MARYEISRFSIKDMVLCYEKDDRGSCGIKLYPAMLEKSIIKDKVYAVEPLVQVKIVGDNYPFNYSQGRTMRNSETTSLIRFKEQHIIEEKDKTIISTYLSDERGLNYIHSVSYSEYSEALEFNTELINNTDKEIMLEMISSFTLGSLTPFIDGLAKESMILHQIRSTWSNEGRLVSIPIEEYQLEPSWKPSGANCIRFGQVGSMPNREYFPFVAVEDIKNGVCWGAQLAIASSWQLEAYRKDDALVISGGLADREKGHWMKILKSGEKFITPKAVVSTVYGDVDMLCHRITENIRKDLRLPRSEENMPLIFNEFCTTWGNPSEKSVENIANKLIGKGIKYFVIDAGWDNPYDYHKQKLWKYNIGDWEWSKELFPKGIGKLSDEIKEMKMILGIWFEFEICAKDSKVYKEEKLFLKRDGYPITSGARRFLDMTKPEVKKRLERKVIEFLKENKINYIKVDYNDNIGIGCDGYESLGEGLRQNVIASIEFLKKMKSEIPELIIETCASGGQRLVIPFMEISSMASFSDAHECTSIPIIAANMHRMILPRQSQIWAVIQKEHSTDYLYYQIAAGVLGRLCFSGNVSELNEEQWKVIDEGIKFYKSVAQIIDRGITKRFGSYILSYKEPEGYQAIVRKSTTTEEVLMVVHTFKNSPQKIEVSLEAEGEIINKYCREGINFEIRNKKILIEGLKDFDGIALRIKN